MGRFKLGGGWMSVIWRMYNFPNGVRIIFPFLCEVMSFVGRHNCNPEYVKYSLCGTSKKLMLI